MSFYTEWLNKLSTLYHTTLLSNKTETHHGHALVLKGIMLSKKSQSQLHIVIPFIQHFWNDKITDWEDISGCQGLGKRGRREVAVPIKRVAQETAELLYIQTMTVITFIYSYATTAQNTYICTKGMHSIKSVKSEWLGIVSTSISWLWQYTKYTNSYAKKFFVFFFK